MLLSIQLDRDNEHTLQTQIFDQIRDMIVQGELPSGCALPASRLLARRHKISRNTVTQAYDRLIAEGYVFTRRGASTNVSAVLPEARTTIARSEDVEPVSTDWDTQKTEVVYNGRRPVLPLLGPGRSWIDFWPGRPNRHHFPLRVWRKLLTDRLTSASRARLSEYGDPVGYAGLREALAEHLLKARGVRAPPHRIIVTAGIQDALNIVARMFVAVGTSVIVENPCYQGAALAFESYGAKLRAVAVDEQGIKVDEMLDHYASLAYVTPSHQFPTGSTLSLERRVKLLDWARKTGAYVVEDDYDSEFRYTGAPLVALAGLDDGRNVIYLGTLSKSLGAGLRMGFILLPENLVEIGRSVKSLMSFGQPWLEQAVLADFISSGAYERHIRRTMNVYQKARDFLVANLEAQFGAADVLGIDCGMHIMWRLPNDFPAAAAIAEEALRHGVQVHTIRSAGSWDDDSPFQAGCLVLGYSALTEDEIASGVVGIARAVDGLERKSPTA